MNYELHKELDNKIEPVRKVMNDVINTRIKELKTDIRKVNEYLYLPLTSKSKISLTVLKDILIEAQSDLKDLLDEK